MRNIGVVHERLAQAGGLLPFAAFMETVLYDPTIGYYTHQAAFGEIGDFVTAPLLSPLFGVCLARQCAEILGDAPGSVIEAGAGNGHLARDILRALDDIGTLPERYFLVERSALRRQQARDLLARETPHLADRIVITDTWPDTQASVVLANELLDALPATRFVMRDKKAHPLSVRAERERLGWYEEPADAELTHHLAAADLPDGYMSEVSPGARDWVSAAAAHVRDKGVLLLIDYGFPYREFYHPDRSGGTLMCHFRHHAHEDPLLLPGLQDITVHVDFTTLARAAMDAGLTLNGYTSQGAFLLSLGLAPRMTEDTRTQLDDINAIKRLTLPHEMGELFKVIAFGRNHPGALSGFHLLDRRGALFADTPVTGIA